MYTLPNDRARLLGRVLFGTTPAADATVRGGDASTTTTAADGTFVLEVPAGLVKLSIAIAGIRRATPAGMLRLAAGQTFELGDLVVPRQPALRGRVVDEQGDPIADAMVVLGRSSDAEAENDPNHASPGVQPDAVTDRDGRFRIDGPRPRSRSLQIERRGYQHAWEMFDPASRNEQDLGTIVMRANPALRGIVHGPHGRPEAGARIVVGGAPYEPLRPYETATTDEHGAFQLDPRYGSHFTVFADGCEPKVVKHEGDTLVHVTMSPAHALHGVVANSQGQPGVVRIAPPPGDYAERHGWLKEVLTTPWPLAADGTFTIPCLPAGQWQCRIEVPGVGRSAFVVVDVPAAASVAFSLLPQRTVPLVVTDDVGAPVPHAAVRCTSKLPGAGEYQLCQDDLRLDAEGRANVPVVDGCEPHLEVTHPAHVPANRQVGRDETTIPVVLPRLGYVAGTVQAPAELLGRCRLIVHANAANGPHGGSSDVDRLGSYRLALAAGDYQLALFADDASASGPNDLDRPIADPLPLVGDFEPLTPAVAVSVQPGTTTPIDFMAPAFAEITGRVLVRGKPLADAIVLASFEKAQVLNLRLPEPPEFDGNRHTFFPHQRTDHTGSFRFLVSSAREVRLSARHGDVGLWSTPIPLSIGSGERRHVDLVLAAAAIRGRVDLGQVPRRERRSVEAQLWPIRDGKAPAPEYDAFGDPRHPSSFLPSRELAADGSFAFECLPPGDYVVRIGNLIAPPIVLHAVNTTGDEVHELGLLTPAVRHAVRVRTDLPANPTRRVHITNPAGSIGSGAFVWLGTVRDSVLELEPLPAGSYQLFLMPSHSGEAATEPTTEQVVSITIGADGSVTPDVVRFATPK
ncbi:MAG: carboxypeptidase-like regulatory domain-containing protein [Planctomycetota bacterium]